ncbi:MAG TPA: ribose-5-phosphate isomerase RpiA [Thermoanaerobaculia bacterium]|nr:ribose-5-phosphate isomerase RpiA [Thermoanaerobaculia bacterium]
MDAREMKIAAARAALDEVRSGMALGLGTGSTAEEFVGLLGEAMSTGRLKGVRCTSTSNRTDAQAQSVGIEIHRLAAIAPLDLAIDGADEIDPQLRLVKGRGGSLLREKIVEQAAKRFIVIADESKLVDRLGTGALPVEVTPFALDVLTERFTAMGLKPSLRMDANGPRITDEGHRILDLRVPAHVEIADLVAQIRDNAGVVETGFFPREASEAIIATPNGLRRMKR